MEAANLQIDRTPEVERLTGLGRVTIWRLVKRREFPLPLKLSDRAIGWRHADILAWLASRPEATTPRPVAE